MRPLFGRLHHCTGSQQSASRWRVLVFYRIAPATRLWNGDMKELKWRRTTSRSREITTATKKNIGTQGVQERFAGVLETGGRKVSFQSFLSILRVFLPDNLSITIEACPWRLILILFASFHLRNDLRCHGERYEFNQHLKHDTVWMKSEINVLAEETKLGLAIVVWFLF